MKISTKIVYGLLAIGAAVGACLTAQHMNPTSVSGTPLDVGEVIQVKDTVDGAPLSIGVSDVSADGNIVLFSSSSTNLPGSSTIGGLYTYNISEEHTERVDVSTSGVLPNGGLDYSTPKLSETGRYATFLTTATNLDDTETMYPRGAMKRDMQAGVTTRTLGGLGTLANDLANRSYVHNISNDGRYVLASYRVDYPFYHSVSLVEGKQFHQVGTSAGSQYGDARAAGMSCDAAFVAYVQQYAMTILDLRRSATTQCQDNWWDDWQERISDIVLQR